MDKSSVGWEKIFRSSPATNILYRRYLLESYVVRMGVGAIMEIPFQYKKFSLWDYFTHTSRLNLISLSSGNARVFWLLNNGVTRDE